MLNNFFDFVDKYKDSTYLLFFRFLNRITNDFFESTYHLFLGWFLPVLYSMDSLSLLWKIIITIILLIILFWFFLSKKFKLRDYYKLKNDIDLLNNNEKMIENLNLLERELNELINIGEKNLFKKISDDMVNILFDYIKEVYNINIRVSVLQQFRNKKGVRMCKIISRRSKNNICPNGKTYTVERKKYFFNKILIDNIEKNIYLDSKDVKKYIKSKLKDDFKEYIAIPVKDHSRLIEFIVQIDIVDKEVFNNDEKKINEFISNYIIPYVLILKTAYSIENRIKESDVRD